jgi:hypothetical protein
VSDGGQAYWVTLKHNSPYSVARCRDAAQAVCMSGADSNRYAVTTLSKVGVFVGVLPAVLLFTSPSSKAVAQPCPRPWSWHSCCADICVLPFCASAARRCADHEAARLKHLALKKVRTHCSSSSSGNSSRRGRTAARGQQQQDCSRRTAIAGVPTAAAG